MMTLTRLVVIESTFSVLTGIRHLYLEGEYLLFTILGLFTVILPVIKLVVLAYAWNRPRSAHHRTLRWMEALGKWSMLDVFVVAVLIASVRLGPLASIELHRGLYFFSASVIMIMIASRVVYLRVRNAAAHRPAAMPPSSC
jgi:paraquat-inducible protein A